MESSFKKTALYSVEALAGIAIGLYEMNLDQQNYGDSTYSWAGKVGAIFYTMSVMTPFHLLAESTGFYDQFTLGGMIDDSSFVL